VVTYLLDTAPFLWAVASPEKLSPAVRRLIESRKHPLFVSVASLWEVVVKARKGLLHHVGRLPIIHKDPFDRLLLAQAASEGWVLVSNDETVRKYPVATVW